MKKYFFFNILVQYQSTYMEHLNRIFSNTCKANYASGVYLRDFDVQVGGN